jgi:hypothetical protein
MNVKRLNTLKWLLLVAMTTVLAGDFYLLQELQRVKLAYQQSVEQRWKLDHEQQELLRASKCPAPPQFTPGFTPPQIHSICDTSL